MSLDDLAMLYEQRFQRYADGYLNSDGTEVYFDEASTAKRQTISVADAKNEKRVTFARLLSRVSAELSSEVNIEVNVLAYVTYSSKIEKIDLYCLILFIFQNFFAFRLVLVLFFVHDTSDV